MIFIFEFISKLSYEDRKEFILYFLEQNSSYELFKKLNFEPSIKSYSGSRVPYLQKDKDFYKSLVNCISGIKFLEHKQHLESEILYIEQQIKHEKKSDFMKDF
jgi:hypothetical protein